jgi:hypothetical protein
VRSVSHWSIASRLYLQEPSAIRIAGSFPSLLQAQQVWYDTRSSAASSRDVIKGDVMLPNTGAWPVYPGMSVALCSTWFCQYLCP